MQRQNVSGTQDWRKYSVVLKYPEEARNIHVGGILVGQGEAWFDNFVLSIDGKNVQFLENTKRGVPASMNDKEFDRGSGIEISNVSQETVINLELLGKIWGFLKYHHPNIANGEYNWDYDLFRFLRVYLGVENRKKRNELLIGWINSLGNLEKCSTCKETKDDAFLKPDFKWIQSLEDPLKERLFSIYSNRNQGKHYYIGTNSNIGNPKFKHESGYSKMPYPDEGFRLLSLFRYWNIINYFFPYKHLTDKGWDQILKEYIPKFLNTRDELEYEFAVLQLIGDINDTHGNLWYGADQIEEWKGTRFPPFHVQFIENQLVLTDFYNPELKIQTGMEVGDVITSINRKPIKQIVSEMSQFYPASNMSVKLRDIATDILRSKSDQIELTYHRNYSEMETTIMVQLYPKDSLNIYKWYPKNEDVSYKMLDNNIGYITLQTIRNKDIPTIWSKFEEAEGIIIDIRNYPSAFVPYKLGDFFISLPTPFVKYTIGNTNNPGEFSFTNGLELTGYGKAFKGKLVVIVNEITQSRAEYTAMAFRAGNNTTIIGSTTAGADGDVSEILLPGGLKTWISGVGIYYPNGRETQRVGIVPDIVVEPTITGIKEGRDELLEKAIELISNE